MSKLTSAVQDYENNIKVVAMAVLIALAEILL